MSTATRTAGPEFQYAPVAAIIPSKTNPRKTFDASYISDLAKSMREVGVLEPVLVRPHGDDRFELIAGECRWRASKEAGLAEIPVRIRPLSDQEVLEVQVIENLQRRDLSPLEEAEGYRQLLATKKYDAARIAERIGMSPKYVYDRIKLLELTKEAQQLLRDGRIAAGHAILLARLTPTDQARAIDPESMALFHSEDDSNLFTAEDDGRPTKAGRFDGYKPCSVRELDSWIAENVRFDPVRDADPMLFPETALALKTATEKSTKVIAITEDHFVQPEARAEDARTYGPQSWKRADGRDKSKTCEFSVLGVIAAGPGRGQAFDVCTAKEKCKTHWAAWQKDREKRAAGQRPSSGPGSAGGNGEQDRWKREEEKRKADQARQQAEQARWRKAAPSILKAVADRVKNAPARAKGQLADLILEDALSSRSAPKNAADLVPRGNTAEDLVRHVAFVLLATEVLDDWYGYKEFPKRAKAFGIDVKKILDEVAPVGPVRKCSECGCTEDKACPGGCGWAKSPDAKTGLGVCTKCIKKVEKAKAAAKRQPAQARA